MKKILSLFIAISLLLTSSTFVFADGVTPSANTLSFTDVPADAYYYDAVMWAVQNGITSGTSDTTFSPGQTCTRAQIITFLYRAASQGLI